jgi:hypothetical protein
MSYSKNVVASLEKVRRGEWDTVSDSTQAVLRYYGLALACELTPKGVQALLDSSLSTPQIMALRGAKKGVKIPSKVTVKALIARGAIDAEGRVTDWGNRLLEHVDSGRSKG